MEMSETGGQIKKAFKRIAANTEIPENAIDVLKRQHREIEDLFDRIETTSHRARKSKWSSNILLRLGAGADGNILQEIPWFQLHQQLK